MPHAFMELIERVIRQNPWWHGRRIEEIANLKARNLYHQILKRINDKQIISIVGLRRVGKSTLLYQFIEHLLQETDAKKILYFSFDEILGKDPEIIERILDLYEEEIIKDELSNVYVFFDEINHVKDWQVILKRYYDGAKIKFFVSGSSSIFLRKAKESLAGRIFEFELHPLDFKEYLYLKGIRIQDPIINQATIKKEMNNFFLNGSFPEIIMEDNVEKIRDYVKSIIEKIIFYDIPAVFDIERPELLKEIFEVIARNPGSLIEYKKFASAFNITYQTASKYISYLEKAFLIRLLYNYRGSPIASARKSKKAYLSAHCSAWAYTSMDDFNSLLPKLIENIAVAQLNAKFFWRKYYEVDIYHNHSLIEVKYRERPDIKGALETAKELKARKLIVITKDLDTKKSTESIEITYIPLWKWLFFMPQ